MDDQRTKRHRLRIARPVRDLKRSVRFYEDILDLVHLGGFEDHEGYSGQMVGATGADWHIEFTRHVSGKPAPSPTPEDLLVLYYARDKMPTMVERLKRLNIKVIKHENPYWEEVGATVIIDPDGYLVVLCPERQE